LPLPIPQIPEKIKRQIIQSRDEKLDLQILEEEGRYCWNWRPPDPLVEKIALQIEKNIRIREESRK